MTRHVVIPLVTAICICAMPPTARAHHSHPYFYDQCKTVTVEGRIDTIEFKDPHSVIVVNLDDGPAYTVDWNPLRRLTNDGIIGPAQAALVPGTRVAVTGNPIRDVAQIRRRFPNINSVNPNTIDPTLIRRVDDRWSWAGRRGPTPPDCVAR
jgi:hypothetical protein